MAKYLLVLIFILGLIIGGNVQAKTIEGALNNFSITNFQTKTSPITGPKIAWGFNNFGMGYRPYYGSCMGGYPMNYGYNNMMYNNIGNRYMYPMNGYGFGSMYNGYTNPYGGVSYSYVNRF